MQGFVDTAAIVPKERVVTEYEESEKMEFHRVDYKRKRSNIKSMRGSRWDD